MNTNVTRLLSSLNVALWGVNSHTYAPGVVDRVVAWLTNHCGSVAVRVSGEPQKLRDALERIVNVSYTELRPLVERYQLDPKADSSLYPGAKGVYRSFATDEQWAFAQRIAERYATLATSALAASPSDDGARQPAEYVVPPTTVGGNETVVKDGIYMSRKPFSELRADMSPESQARATERTQEMLAELPAAASDDGAARPQPAQADLTCWWCRVVNAGPMVCNDEQTTAMCGECAQKVADFMKPRAALSSPSVADSPTWQPIETAPLDGTEVLLCRVSSHHGGYEDIEHGSWGFIETSDWDGMKVYGWLTDSGRIEEPTHWMPKLSAPSASV